jgi:hypothetical protein
MIAPRIPTKSSEAPTEKMTIAAKAPSNEVKKFFMQFPQTVAAIPGAASRNAISDWCVIG